MARKLLKFKDRIPFSWACNTLKVKVPWLSHMGILSRNPLLICLKDQLCLFKLSRMPSNQVLDTSTYRLFDLSSH